MKTCRQCEITKPLVAFARRTDTGGYRNQCIRCRNGEQQIRRCESCAKVFGGTNAERTLCAACRPPLTKPCATCGVQFVGSMDQRRYCSPSCRVVAVKRQREAAHDALRQAALVAYSGPRPFCACCGDGISQFLALDHIDGGGHQHRKKLGGGGFWTWLKRNGYPSGFRVLCHNCNLGRQVNGGACPHDVLVRELVGSVT
jgi:hypothetical protein